MPHHPLTPAPKRSVRQQWRELPLSFKAFWTIGLVTTLVGLARPTLLPDQSWGLPLIQTGTLIVFLGSALETRRVGGPYQVAALLAVGLTLLTVWLIVRDTSF